MLCKLIEFENATEFNNIWQEIKGKHKLAEATSKRMHALLIANAFRSDEIVLKEASNDNSKQRISQ